MDAPHLESLITRIPNFAGWAHPTKIRLFTWFTLKSTPTDRIGLKDVKRCYALSQVKHSANLNTDMSRMVERGELLRDDRGFYLERQTRVELEEQFGKLLAIAEPPLEDRVGLLSAPLLTEDDVTAARQMGQLYLVLHCFENSVRRVIARVLGKALGESWWTLAANSDMQRKVSDRQKKEAANRWLSPRGASPLFYLDWGDLVCLIRKHEAHFNQLIGGIKFIELKIEELENLRNIVAHNGMLSSPDDLTRVELNFKDWCRQVKLAAR